MGEFHEPQSHLLLFLYQLFHLSLQSRLQPQSHLQLQSHLQFLFRLQFVLEPEDPDDLTDIAERLEEKLGVYCRYISSDEFEGLCFRSINGWSEEPAEMFVISTEKIPDLLKQAYASREELVGEFRQYFKELPEDFNLETHIGYYSASIFC